MRKSILILPMCLWMTHYYAQKVLPQLEEPFCAEYIQDAGLDKFVGTWIGEKEEKKLEIVLIKTKIHIPTLIPSYLYDECFDVIYGVHKLEVNGVEVENILNLAHSSVYEKEKKTILANTEESDPNILIGTIHHKSKKRSVNFVISYIDAQHIKIVSLEKPTGIRIVQPGEPTHWTIDFPEDIILTKQ